VLKVDKEKGFSFCEWAQHFWFKEFAVFPLNSEFKFVTLSYNFCFSWDKICNANGDIGWGW